MARATRFAALALLLANCGAIALAQHGGQPGAASAAPAAAGTEAEEVYVDQYGNPIDAATAAYYQQYYAQNPAAYQAATAGEGSGEDQVYYYYYDPSDEAAAATAASMTQEGHAGGADAAYPSTAGAAYSAPDAQAAGAALPAAANTTGGYAMTPDGQYYYYYYEDVPADEQAPAGSGNFQPAKTASGSSHQVGTLEFLAPGVNWMGNSYAMAQAIEEVPPLPGTEDEIQIDPPGFNPGDSPDGPTFGTQQEEARRAAIEVLPLQFLRTQSVLLDKGERQIDIGFSYAIFEGFALVPQVIAGVPEISPIRIRQRVMLAPVEFRYGVTDHVQWFCNIPLGWANTEISFPGSDEFSSKSGIGDVNTGFSTVLNESCGYGPDVIFTLAMTAPTGPTDFPVVPTVPNARLGQGFWGVSSSLLCIHTIDPVVAFYGVGYLHRFDADFRNGLINVDPGESFIYQFGVGFGVNESVSLSTSFLGVYITEDHVNGQRVEGGILEPMRMRFAATFAQPCKIVEPFAEIGMTRDAASGRIGITFTY